MEETKHNEITNRQSYSMAFELDITVKTAINIVGDKEEVIS
jgi:hypothetical protein